MSAFPGAAGATRVIVLLAALATPPGAPADWINLTGAETAPNIAEIYVLDDSVKVDEAMARGPVTIGPDEPITKALDLFIELKFGALPVVDGDKKLVGILSTIDMLRAYRDSLSAD